MQDHTEMRWALSQLTRWRINQERIDCTKLAMQALVQRVPYGEPIDAAEIATTASALAATTVGELVKNKLI